MRRLSQSQIERRLLRRPRRLPAHAFVPDPEQEGQGDLSYREMRSFDALPEHARRAIAESRFGVAVADTYAEIVRRGASDQVKHALRAKGLTPSDVGTEGCLLEEVTLMEAAESKRILDEVEGRVLPRSTHADFSPAIGRFGFGWR